jgi:hypothetical protein
MLQELMDEYYGFLVFLAKVVLGLAEAASRLPGFLYNMNAFQAMVVSIAVILVSAALYIDNSAGPRRNVREEPNDWAEDEAAIQGEMTDAEIQQAMNRAFPPVVILPPGVRSMGAAAARSERRSLKRRHRKN